MGGDGYHEEKQTQNLQRWGKINEIPNTFDLVNLLNVNFHCQEKKMPTIYVMLIKLPNPRKPVRKSPGWCRQKTSGL